MAIQLVNCSINLNPINEEFKTLFRYILGKAGSPVSGYPVPTTLMFTVEIKPFGNPALKAMVLAFRSTRRSRRNSLN